MTSALGLLIGCSMNDFGFRPVLIGCSMSTQFSGAPTTRRFSVGRVSHTEGHLKTRYISINIRTSDPKVRLGGVN